MIVTAKAMDKYRNKLRAVNSKCAEEVQAYMVAHSFRIDDNFITYAHSLTTKYGEAAAELSCQLYDELSSYWMKTHKGKVIAPAEPAEVATVQDVAKTVYGTAKTSLTQIPEALGTLAKRAAEDTTLHNALRDGAEFAWIPQGDTCAFCRVIASNGWRKMSKKALKNGHAEHIHPNCDCSYVTRLSDDIEFEGYDPEALYREYQELGKNGIARKLYAENKDKINAQHRKAYAIRKGKTVPKVDTPKFNPAKTIEEAEQFARDNFASGYLGSKVSFKGIDLNHANKINETLNKLVSSSGKKISGIEVVNPKTAKGLKLLGGDADAMFATNPLTGAFYINKEVFKTEATFLAKVKEGKEAFEYVIKNKLKLSASQREIVELYEKAGKQLVDETVEGLITHEYGHLLAVEINPSKEVMQGISNNMSKHIISGYSQHNTSEYLAESFVEYILGDKNKLDKSVVKLFDEVMK